MGQRRAVSERVRVLVVDDHDLFRRGLRRLLQQEGVQVVGEAASGEEALQLAERREPDVVVMDLHMPGMGGLEATRRLARGATPTPVVVLTISSADPDVIEAVEAGAEGYLLKDAATEEIVRGIHAAAEGKLPLSPEIAKKVVERARTTTRENPPSPVRHADLSKRELQVLSLLSEGKGNAEIGQELFISPATVKDHVSAILAKLGVSNRVQAAIHAVRTGLI
jgi:two-component system, NarL family, response regulator LiaR